jgi:hypothetical protein
MSARDSALIAGKLVEAAVDALWRQWRAIGGAAAGGPASAQVDPEVLCLASLALESHESRLWTVMIDWLRLGSGLVSVQRLRNVKRHLAVPKDSLERFAGAVIQGANDARFKALLSNRPRTAAGRSVVSRSRRVKQRSGGPALTARPALMLRLRAAFGVGVKADLLAFLLGQPLRVTVGTAAAALGYSVPAVFRAIQDLEPAGFVRSTAAYGAAEYWVDSLRWSALLDTDNDVPRWAYWREILTYVSAVVRWEERLAERSVSDYARGASLRDVAIAHEADLARAGVFSDGPAFPRSPVLDEWHAFHQHLAKEVGRR